MKQLSLLCCAVLFSQPLYAQELIGHGNADWGNAQYNRCLDNVEDRFDALAQRERGDVLGFHLNSAPNDLSMGKHWQGIQRLKAANGNFMFVSRSSATSATAGVAVVEMASRDNEGQRLRSNRLAWEKAINDTAPDADDSMMSFQKNVIDGVTSFQEGSAGDYYLPASSTVTGEAYHHAGGMQLYGDVLVVAVEGKDTSLVAGLTSEVLFYDVSDPKNIVQLDYSVQRSGANAGNVAISRLADDRYLLMVGDANATPLDFYISTSTDLKDSSNSFEHYYQWVRSQHSVAGVDNNYGAYQNTQLVSQCNSSGGDNDGKLYIVATHNNSDLANGADWMDLYRVDDIADGSIELRKVKKKNLVCKYRGTKQCNLDAGAGTYISPEGELLLYAVEHKNDGPKGSAANDSIKFTEFAPLPAKCNSMDKAWVEIFYDSNFEDRSLVIDYADKGLRNYKNFKKVEGFGDKASSVRWCLPKATEFTLFEHDTYRGDEKVLSGNSSSSAQSISSLGSYGFNDDTSSAGFVITGAVEGSWTSSGGRSSTSSGNPAYILSLSQSESVEINLMSSVDTYLYLLNSSGSVIASNDDGGAGYNSKITKSLSAGTYKVISATYSSGKSGSFDLTTSAGDLSQ